MKIYVAGKDLARATEVMRALRHAGHKITYDWVAAIEDTSDMTKKAADECEAIRSCDILVYLWEADQESARYEAGMAMGLGKKVIVSGKDNAHFFSLQNVETVNSDEQIVDRIQA